MVVLRERRSSAKAAAARSNAPSAGSGASATGIGGTAARSFARRVALVVDAPAAASRKRDVFFFGAIYKNKKGERFFVDIRIPDTVCVPAPPGVFLPDTAPRIIAMPHLERGPTSHEHD